MDRHPRVLIRVLSILGRDGVFLRGHGLAGENATILKHHGRITKYEVDSPIDGALTNELSIRVHIKRILVPDNVAPVNHGVIRPDTEGDGLVLCWAGIVLKRYVPCNKARSSSRCGPTTRKVH